MLIDALRQKNHQGRPPVWFMRQAGRYLPRFREIRKLHSFWESVFTPDIATEITLLPEKELGVDALILFADILVIFEAFGGKVVFPGGRPYAECSFEQEAELCRMDPIMETIRQVKQKSGLPLIGFAGGPFTTLTYLTPNPTKKMLEKVASATRAYVEKQIEAGVDAIQIFDSWAAVEGLEKMQEICFPYVEKIVKDLPVPTIFFAKEGSKYAKTIVQRLGVNALGIDNTRSFKEVRHEVGAGVTLQGYLSPDVLFGSADQVRRAVTDILDETRGDPGFVFNLGHGVKPATPVENVQLAVSLVRKN